MEQFHRRAYVKVFYNYAVMMSASPVLKKGFAFFDIAKVMKVQMSSTIFVEPAVAFPNVYDAMNPNYFAPQRFLDAFGLIGLDLKWMEMTIYLFQKQELSDISELCELVDKMKLRVCRFEFSPGVIDDAAQSLRPHFSETAKILLGGETRSDDPVVMDIEGDKKLFVFRKVNVGR